MRQVPENKMHEWLRARFILDEFSIAGIGCQVTWWWRHPRFVT